MIRVCYFTHRKLTRWMFLTPSDPASVSHSPPRMKYIWTGHMCAVAAYGVCGKELWTLLLNTLSCNGKVLVRAHGDCTLNICCTTFVSLSYDESDTLKTTFTQSINEHCCRFCATLITHVFEPVGRDPFARFVKQLPGGSGIGLSSLPVRDELFWASFQTEKKKSSVEFGQLCFWSPWSSGDICYQKAFNYNQHSGSKTPMRKIHQTPWRVSMLTEVISDRC